MRDEQIIPAKLLLTNKYFTFVKASNTVILIRFDYNDSFSICQSKNNQIALPLNILYVIKRVSIYTFSLGTDLIRFSTRM